MAFKNSLISLCLVALIASAQSRFSHLTLIPSDYSTALPPSAESPLPSAESPLASFDSFLDSPTHLEQFSSSMISAAGSYPIVTKICSKTDHPDLCFATVVPFVDGSKIDLNKVLKITVEAGGEYAKVALAEVKKLTKNKDNSAGVKMTLRDCKDGYDTAVDNFGKTVEAFVASDIGTMRSMLSATMTFVGDCEDEFVELGEPSPLSGYSEKLTALSSNSLAIIEQMLTQ